MEYRSPGIPAGRSGTVHWRNNFRRAGLRAGCLLGAVGLITVFSVILSVSLAPVDTAGILMPTARAAGIGQADNGQGNTNGRGDEIGRGGETNQGDNGQGSAGDPSGYDPGDDGQGNNKDEGDGADGAGVTTEGRGQAGGARAKGGVGGGEHRGGRGARGARGARGEQGATESRPESGTPGGIMDDDFEDHVAAGSAAAVREALRATVLSADEEAAVIAAGWVSID